MNRNFAAALELDNLETAIRQIQAIVSQPLDPDDLQMVRQLLDQIIDRTEQILSQEMS